MIHTGSFGCLPLNPLTLAYLHAGQADLLLGYRDTAETTAFKQRPSISVQTGEKSENAKPPSSKTQNSKPQIFSLDGKFFNGHSDALYRGLLPEVLLVAPDESNLNDVLRDFLEYLQKIVGMGFFLPKKMLVRRNPVDEHIPCTILTGNGLLFSHFMTCLVRELEKLSKEFPVLDEGTRVQILGRFVRGIPDVGSGNQELWLDASVLQVPTGRVVSLPQAPQVIRIAGGSAHTRNTIQTVLSNYRLIAIPETHSRNAVERLEFENILWRVSTVIMPTLATSAEEKKQLSPRAVAGIFSMGRHRHAFDESDNVEQLLSRFDRSETGGKAKKSAKASIQQHLNERDADLLRELGQYAASLGMSEEQHLYETLAKRIAVATE